MPQLYKLPQLDYGYGDLAPYISEQQLTLHHQKHHAAYVNAANTILTRLEKSRSEGAEYDVKSALKELSFNVAGHLLHSLFWENMAPHGKGGSPSSSLSDAIESEFGSFEQFKKEFSKAAVSVEGSGWAALTACPETGRLLLMQIEKHNMNVIPTYRILLVLDLFEHAYYLDYKNDRAKFIESFWNIINWDTVNKRLKV